MTLLTGFLEVRALAASANAYLKSSDSGPFSKAFYLKQKSSLIIFIGVPNVSLLV